MRTRILSAVVGVTLALAAAAPAQAAPFLGLTGDNELLPFDSAYPGSPGTAIPITGLQQSESIHGIDFRPANGMLYGLGSTSRLYTINTQTGAATEVGLLGTTLAGNVFAFDFNPVGDRLVVVSDSDQTLVVNPDTGTATSGPAPMYTGGTPNPYIIGSAFSNSMPGATSTTMYVIDFNTSYLGMMDPSSGLITNVGPLGVSPGPLTGFDITRDGMGFFASGPFFHMVNLSTGNSPSAGMFPNPLFVKGLAAVPPANGSPGGGTPGGGAPGGGTPDLTDPLDANGNGQLDFFDVLLLNRHSVTDDGFRMFVPGASLTQDEVRHLVEFARRGLGSFAAQRRRVVLARKRVTVRGTERKRVLVPFTKAGKRYFRTYKKKRLKVTITVRERYIPEAGSPQTGKGSRTVTFRVKRKRR